jgi:general secretion pathway protein F
MGRSDLLRTRVYGSETLGQVAAVPLDVVIALSDEIAALARAGVPLERGLAALGKERRGALERYTAELAERMERGESLPQLIAREDASLPPLLRAVIAAGLRSGQLGICLERLADMMRRAADLRQAMFGALLYPLLVLVVAYLLFVVSVIHLVPPMLDAYSTFRVAPPWLLTLLARASESWQWWWYWPLVVLGIAVSFVWWRLRRGVATTRGRSLLRMYRFGRLSAFAETLALLLEQQLPLPDALELAAGASGDGALIRASQAYASQVQQGQTPTADRFPPLIGMVLAAPQPAAETVRCLRRLAQDYARRARRDVNWMSAYLPAMLTIFLGGGAALAAIYSFLFPWVRLLTELSVHENF